MSTTRTCILTFAVLAALFVVPCHAGEKTPFTGTAFLSGVVSFGMTTCPGYPDVHPTYPSPCPGRTNLRGFVFTQTIVNSPLRGEATVELNYNVDSNLEGQYWGKWSIDLVDGGVLEGSYSGRLDWYNGYLRALGKGELHGTGGALDGCLVVADSDANFSDPPYLDIFSGYIMNPHAKK